MERDDNPNACLETLYQATLSSSNLEGLLLLLAATNPRFFEYNTGLTSVPWPAPAGGPQICIIIIN